MEIKKELTKARVQSILRTSKLLSDLNNDFKEYHFTITDQLENDDDVQAEKETLDQHELKVMELIDIISKLVGEPSQTKECSDKVKNPGDADEAKVIVEGEFVDVHVLNNYPGEDQESGAEGKLGAREKENMSLVDFRGRLERASHVERILFILRVHISRLTEERKKEPDSKVVGTPLVAGVNLPKIDIPTFDSNILNWRLVWEQF